MIGKVFLGLLMVFGLFVLAAVFGNPEHTGDPMQRIAQSCQREYAMRGEGAVSECRIRLMIHLAEDQERARMQRALNGSR